MHFKRGLSLDEARKQARGVIGAVAKDRDPLAERRMAERSAENTLRSVVENYLAREGRKLRTTDDRRATFERLVYPRLGARQIDEIRRSEINSLLDQIEDQNGPRMATLTLAYLRRVMNWHATRADDFRSPIVKGMARGTANKRERILTDDELRAFWRASQGWDHPFSHMLRFALLTAVRRDEAADMRWSEIEDDVWTIPAARYKTGIDFELPLSGSARDMLAAVTKFGRKGFVFTTNGTAPISGFAKTRPRSARRGYLVAWKSQGWQERTEPGTRRGHGPARERMGRVQAYARTGVCRLSGRRRHAARDDRARATDDGR
jgi:integrase